MDRLGLASHRFLVAGYDSFQYDLSHSVHSYVNERQIMGRNGNENDSHYAAVDRSDVPQGRKGKHRKAVADILADLSKLSDKQAVKIPLNSLNGEKMQNLRSALNRVTREKKLSVLTSSDEKYFYVWRADLPKHAGVTE